MRIYIPLLLFYGLATYRLALMLSEDSGPVKMFTRLRSWLRREEKKSHALKKSDLAHGVACLRCTSVWVSAPVAVFAYYHQRWELWFATAGDIFLSAMALSSLALLFNRMFSKR